MTTSPADIASPITIGHYLNGSAVTPAGGRSQQVFNPATGAVSGHVALASSAEVDAAVALELGSHRPVKRAKEVACPLLVQIADFDRLAPPHAAAKAAVKGRAEVRHYPGDHFDVWPGKDFFAPALAHQVHFLTRHLAPQASTERADDR